MPLDPVKLDDLNWSEMVASVRRRIPAVSRGLWTLHAPVDPGVTLLELFAWLLEQRIYWMDQVPDALTRAALRLLGEAPQQSQSSATVMHFSSPEKLQVLPSMTEFRLVNRRFDDQAPRIVFTAADETTLLPFVPRTNGSDKLGLVVGGKPRTVDLEQGKAITLFPLPDAYPEKDGPIEVRIVLHLRREIEPDNAARFALFFDLGEPEAAGLPSPQWLPDAVHEVSPPAKLIWSYRQKTTGQFTEFPTKQVEDGTLGLRRSGLIAFQLPDDWAAEKGSDGELLYALCVRFEQARFTAPPRLQRLIPNVVIATHRRIAKQAPETADWLPLPGHTIALSETPQELASGQLPIEQTVKLWLKEPDREHEWTLTDDLTFHGPRDRVFVLDRARAEISFGDGLTGRLPVLSSAGAPNIRVEYEVGGGEAGNVGTNLQWELQPPVQDFQPIIDNVVPAGGGADPESLAAARERAGAKIESRTRAITRDDYRELALSTPGVVIKRARAAIGAHPQHPCVPVFGAVTLFIVPAAPREELAEDFDGAHIESALVVAPMPDPGALAAVDLRLQHARLLGNDVFVRAPKYRPVGLTIEIDSDSANRTQIGHRIKRQLSRFLDPLIGGSEHTGLPFGQPLRPSVITREAQIALGDEGRIESVVIRLLDTPDEGDGCHDVVIGAHELVELREVNFKFLRAAADNEVFQGGLR